MGNFSSSSTSNATPRRLNGTTNFTPISAKVVGLDGRLEEFRRRTTTAEVVSGHPDCYLCSSDTMVINSIAPQLPNDYVLQFGQIYFLMPLSKSLTPLSLQDLCVLAIKASIAIGNNSCVNSGRTRVRESSLRVCVSCRKLSSGKKVRSLLKV
ncbi:hypothetical protein CASFOL_036118 [Castilleja foliolosa]|uniref:Uncharacterized protein n=1 Tax=Castilleja foliolosa TaxID=1961234 RepID=A0ABD3BW64_9LAMI